MTVYKKANPTLLEALAPREREVLKLHLAGLTQTEISEHTGIQMGDVGAIIKSVAGDMYLKQIEEVRAARPDKMQEMLAEAIETGVSRIVEMIKDPNTDPKDFMKLMEFVTERCPDMKLSKVSRVQVSKVSAVLQHQNIQAANDRVRTARRALMDGVVDVTPDDENADCSA